MPETTTAAPAGGSNYDQIGAALSSGPEPSQAESGDATETEVQETPVETAPPAEEAAAPETATEPEVEPPAPEVEPDPYATDDTEVPAETLNTLLKTDRGRQIYASHKTLREFAKPVDQGGIGHVPSVEQLRDYYGAYRDRVVMEHDLGSANPQQAERLLSFLFDPGRGPGAQQIASQMAATLAKLNPETYASAAQPFITNYASALQDRYEEARNSGDEKLRNALWYAANVAHYDMTGEWLKPGGQPANGASQAQPDPLAGERSKIAQERAELDRVRNETAQSQDNAWRQQVGSQIRTAVFGELTKALAPLKASSTARQFDMYQRDFHDQVLAAARQGDRHAWDLYQVKVADARRGVNGINLPNEFVKLVAPYIKQERIQFLKEAGVANLQQHDARQAELRRIDSKKEVSNGSGGGGAVQQAPFKRNPGELTSDFNLRQLKALG